MDLGVGSSESWKGCNPINQKRKTFISCQGDSPESEVGCSEGDGHSSNKNGTSRRKSSVNVNERQRKFSEMQCRCLTSKKTDSKSRRENEVKSDAMTKNFAFKDSKGYDGGNKLKNKKCFHTDMTSCEKLLTASLLELSGKVEFLLQTQKNYGFMDKYTEQSHSSPSFFGSSWPLYNLNHRLCQAEEKIEKLTLILEDLFKNSNGKKENVPVGKNSAYRNQVQKATPEIQTRFTKSRIDWPLSSTTDIVESNSAEGLCSRAVPEPTECLFNRKLENEKGLREGTKKGATKQLRGCTPVPEETENKLQETTSRLLAQEALLKSYLDKVQHQLYSKLDLPAKGFSNSNQSLLNIVIHSTTEEENVRGVESDVLSFSDDTCVFCETENDEKDLPTDSSVAVSKFSTEEQKKVEKEETTVTSSSSKAVVKPIKPLTEQPSRKRKPVLSASQKPSQNLQSIPEIVSQIPGKIRTLTFKTEQRPLTAPSPRVKFPFPSGVSKSPSKNYVRPSTQESSVKASAGNNVKNKNKSLVNRKALVGES